MMRRPTFVLALLTALNLLNYLDRFLVMAVSPRFQVELGLGDAQVGLVVSAFMVGYFVTSPLFGWLGDRGPRRGWIAGGVVLWSLATIASGQAKSFGALMVARACVGVGEASYASLSPTIIDDMAPPHRKSSWQAVFYAAIPVGSALGFLLGGWLDLRFGWRMAFGLAGVPGVALGLFTLLLREPPKAPRPRETVGQLIAPLRIAPYRLAVAGYAAQTFALGGFTAWAAPFLVRRLCLELHRADYWFGLTTVVTGLVGTLVGGWWTDRIPGENRVAVCLQVCARSSAVAAPLALLALLLPSPTGFFLGLGAAELALFTSVAPINLALLQSVPPWQRASAMALSIFGIHLFGDLLSPPLIGGLSDFLGDAPKPCSASRGLLIGMLCLPIALVLSYLFWRLAVRAATMARRLAPASGQVDR